MIKVPEINDLDLAFGQINHMPDFKDVPDDIKEHRSYWCNFMQKWFFKGISKDVIDLLVAKQGIDKENALKAVKAILVSYGPKHEHKMAGTAYLMSEWFEEPQIVNFKD